MCDRLVSLFHRRWAVPVLAELERARGAKFVTLSKRLGVGRDPLRATLDDLIALGLIARNPGHGHPMRPEYLLTAEGLRLAPFSGRLLQTARRLDVEPLTLKKWTMPVTWALGGEPLRFSALRDRLPRITPRALTLSLKDMQEHRLIVRDVYEDYPPSTVYRLDRRARPLLTALEPLAKAV